MSNDDYPSLILLFHLVWKENQAQMVQNRMMNLSSSQAAFEAESIPSELALAREIDTF